ncbi:hypothetical protein [Aestuariivivens insulae]|uniref:hypothetical protein n=1 Tax=Aestuariivivens insulae TaxID=1621988 RepID=UPI001F5AF78C|nr:hypothetical protein [Aestuariivivens insulae]
MFKYTLYSFTALFFGLLLVTCKSETSKQTKDKISNNLVIDVITEAMEFQMIDTIPSGWNTFRYKNLSHEVHFFILEKLPNGIRLENYKNELVPPFIKATEYMLAGNMEEGFKQFENIPKWFDSIEVSGGVGLVSPNSTAKSTIYLKPGIYAMECYIRMPNGMAHAFFGMLKEVIVLDTKSTISEPEANINISISSTKGIILKDSITKGKHIFKVDFKDQIKYETMLGHDINLIKVNNPKLLDTVNTWINAADLNSLRSPSPKGVTFLGGVNDCQEGTSGYFYAEITSGQYALISEVPNAKSRNMLLPFTVK